jgi:hypothetical protein
MVDAITNKFKMFGKMFTPSFFYDGRTALVHFAMVQHAVDAVSKVNRMIGTEKRLHVRAFLLPFLVHLFTAVSFICRLTLPVRFCKMRFS